MELEKFLKEKCELSWRGRKLICWIDFDDLTEFTNNLGYSFLWKGDFEVTLLDDCISFDCLDLLDYMEIEPNKICKKEEEE